MRKQLHIRKVKYCSKPGRNLSEARNILHLHHDGRFFVECICLKLRRLVGISSLLQSYHGYVYEK